MEWRVKQYPKKVFLEVDKETAFRIGETLGKLTTGSLREIGEELVAAGTSREDDDPWETSRTYRRPL